MIMNKQSPPDILLPDADISPLNNRDHGTQGKRAIEVGFPIVEINRLAVPEMYAFKPVYQMHKWFARRASCVFRAILLAAMKPAGTNIMDEFYKDHTHDLDTNGKIILDPFMGGGTTIVEALRLGCNTIGVDLNPVAWFIVKTEVEPVDLNALKGAFDRLANRKVSWSGRSVQETLLSEYSTICPCCQSEADIVYTFWVRSGVCMDANCRREVPLHRDYIIAEKSVSILNRPDVTCSHCGKTFDWEIEPASLVVQRASRTSNPTSLRAAVGGNRRWAYSANGNVDCPWCHRNVQALPSKAKNQRKKVSLTVLLCPYCEEVWQWRGDLPDLVQCPTCYRDYAPREGTLPDNYDFVCSCTNRSGILDSLRGLPMAERRRLHPYAVAGYCPTCAGGMFPDSESDDSQEDMFGAKTAATPQESERFDHDCSLRKSKGRFFRRITTGDLARYQEACQRWELLKNSLPYPQQEIPFGYQTVKGNDLPGHGFSRWHDLFNARQLLCLSTLLQAIEEEPVQVLREMLLSAFFQALRSNCLLSFYSQQGDKLEPGLSRKDFAPPKSPLENSVWGTRYGRGTFSSIISRIIAGKAFCLAPTDRRFVERNAKGKLTLEEVKSNERIIGTAENVQLHAHSSVDLGSTALNGEQVDLVITDPPYADNVNYSEVADFFYVWLRLALSKDYLSFAPEFTPKTEEIIAQETRGRSMEDFKEGLSRVFSESAKVLKNDGLLVFTFHHEANTAWESVLESLLIAGFAVEAVYPYESDARKAGSMGAQKIAYDLIHVCKKRSTDATIPKRSWASIRQEIRRRAREELLAIELGRYGSQPLPEADVRLICIGKCLELYSAHYGQVLDHENIPLPLRTALQDISAIVDQLVTKDHPLPAELEALDALSYIWLKVLAQIKNEITVDIVSKALRGMQVSIEDLQNAGLIVRGRKERGRTYEVKQPAQRLGELLKQYQPGLKLRATQGELFTSEGGAIFYDITLVDLCHVVIGLADARESIVPWLERFAGLRSQLRAALRFVRNIRGDWKEPIDRVLALIEGVPLLTNVEEA
jgi:putative DNA methylase